MKVKAGDRLVCIDDRSMINLIKKKESFVVSKVTGNLIWILIEGQEFAIDWFELDEYWELDIKSQRKEKLLKIIQ